MARTRAKWEDTGAYVKKSELHEATWVPMYDAGDDEGIENAYYSGPFRMVKAHVESEVLDPSIERGRWMPDLPLPGQYQLQVAPAASED